METLISSTTDKDLAEEKNRPRISFFYFLGHLPHHFDHARLVFEKLGGEVLVTTPFARDYCLRRGIPVKMLDRCEKEIRSWVPEDVPVTVEYLNQQKGVVFFFDVFPNMAKEIKSLLRIMLFHGNSLKQSWFEDWRIKALRSEYDFITTLGPFWERILKRKGVPENKFLRIGQTRTDTLGHLQPEAIEAMKRDFLKDRHFPEKPIVAYIPTWYGVSSVGCLGPHILETISERFVVLFRPHPETPSSVLDSCRKVICGKKHIVDLSCEEPEGWNPMHWLLMSDLLILDMMGSLTAEAILTDKPIIFTDPRSPWRVIWKQWLFSRPIRRFYRSCPRLGFRQLRDLNTMVERNRAIQKTDHAREEIRNKLFYHRDARATDALVEFVESLEIKSGMKPKSGKS
ncbi:MAG: CDP-glycerol glycerophosphotransferase family protein [Candidatus Omnitrophica bacterium]|nr:CDP-glycerol glycerophosphotransferase family protein [Candidatus Omnitrophota bacterium]